MNIYLVNHEETRHSLYVNAMLESLGIQCKVQKDISPKDYNPIQAFFNKSIEKTLMPYVIAEPMLFDTSNLDAFLEQRNLRCPTIDKEQFMVLMDYAKTQDFGMKLKESTQNAPCHAEH